VREQEERAVATMAVRYPYTINGYAYHDLLAEAQQKATQEAQFVSYLDKFDAFGEALHEVFGGNTAFAEPVHNEYGDIPTPVQFYIEWFAAREAKTPLLSPLFRTDEAFFRLPEGRDFMHIARSGALHTKESIERSSGYPPYDLWKGIILQSGDEKEIRNLCLQKESPAISLI
jgi:hypothetical protein